MRVFRHVEAREPVCVSWKRCSLDWVSDQGRYRLKASVFLVLFDVSLFQAEHVFLQLHLKPLFSSLMVGMAEKNNNRKTTNYPATAIETNRWWEKWSVCDTVSDRWQMHCGIKRDYCFAGLLERRSALQLLWQLRCNLGINVIVCWRGWHFKNRSWETVKTLEDKKLR